MARSLAALIFALATAATTFAGTGLVVAPHVDPPGTPLFHDHPLGSYRFSLYELHVVSHLTSAPGFDVPTFAVTLADDLVLCLLAMLASRLPRPTRRLIGHMAAPAFRPPQWRAPIVPLPPRSTVLVTIP